MLIFRVLCFSFLCSVICFGGEDVCGFERLGGSFDEKFFLRVNRKISDADSMQAAQSLGSNERAKEWYEKLIRSHDHSDALKAALLIGKGEMDGHFYNELTRVDSHAVSRTVASALQDSNAKEFYSQFRREDTSEDSLAAASMVQGGEIDGNFYESARSFDPPNVALRVAKELHQSGRWTGWYLWLRKKVKSDSAMKAIRAGKEKRINWDFYVGLLKSHSSDDALKLALSARE